MKEQHSFLIDSENMKIIRDKAIKEDRSLNYVLNELLKKGIGKK